MQSLMKILHISDTHGCHHSLTDLPGADIIVHSGDLTMADTEGEVVDFLNWFCDLPYAHKIFIGGNHDSCLYEATLGGLDSNCHYLCNSPVVIDGLRFYGIPLFMPDCISEKLNTYYESLPADIDVLITHAPPYGILDFDKNIHFGSEELLIKVTEINPKLHLFGHIHNGYGICRPNTTIFSNGSILDGQYARIGSPYNVLEV